MPVARWRVPNLDRASPAYPMLSVIGAIKVCGSSVPKPFNLWGTFLNLRRAIRRECRTKLMQDFDFSYKKRILYVDGYEDNRLLLGYILEQRGYSCVTVSTMRAGLAIASSRVFDLYVLDSWYGDGTGVD